VPECSFRAYRARTYVFLEAPVKRTLSLKRERIVELSTDDLTNVVAGRPDLPTIAVDCLSLSCPQATCNCCTASASC
jgi:hypothetical protein